MKKHEYLEILTRFNEKFNHNKVIKRNEKFDILIENVWTSKGGGIQKSFMNFKKLKNK